MPWELNGKGNMLAAWIEGEKQGSSNNENDGMYFLPGLIGCSLFFFPPLPFSFVVCMCFICTNLLNIQEVTTKCYDNN